MDKNHNNEHYCVVVGETDRSVSSCGLARAERILLHQRPLHKQAEFIRGRWAAKRVIQQFALRHYGLELNTDDCAVLAHKNGQPHVVIAGDSVSNKILTPLISISHSSGVGAVALLAHSANFSALGIDIEKIRHFADATIFAFMTSRERIFFESVQPHERNRIATIVWTLKEAYLKACGTGLRIHPARIDILPFLDKTLSQSSQVIGDWTEVGGGTILSKILIVR